MIDNFCDLSKDIGIGVNNSEYYTKFAQICTRQ